MVERTLSGNAGPRQGLIGPFTNQVTPSKPLMELKQLVRKNNGRSTRGASISLLLTRCSGELLISVPIKVEIKCLAHRKKNLRVSHARFEKDQGRISERPPEASQALSMVKLV